MYTYKQAQRSTAFSFTLMNVIVPAVVIIGMMIVMYYILPVHESPRIDAEKFVAAVLSVFSIILFVVAPGAFFYAYGNRTLVNGTLKDFLLTLENMHQNCEECLMDAQRILRDLKSNRKKLLETSWLKYTNDDVLECEIQAKKRIVQIKGIIGSSSIKERLTHQEYFVTLNQVLLQLEDIMGTVPELLKTKVPDDVYKILCERTQGGFEKQVQTHENYISELKGRIRALSDQIQEIKNLLS